MDNVNKTGRNQLKMVRLLGRVRQQYGIEPLPFFFIVSADLENCGLNSKNNSHRSLPHRKGDFRILSAAHIKSLSSVTNLFEKSPPPVDFAAVGST
jgi:hypothetical protein